MKLNEIISNDKFKLLTNEVASDKEIEGLYYGDLLSWVMAHANTGDAWITVQTHINIIAVANLLNISCIIIPEDIKVEDETINKANDVNIALISTNLNSFEIFKELYEAGLK